MATSKDHFDHGDHNKLACDLLATNGNFPDWTITTAFYAALHYVSSKIFPFNYTPKPGAATVKFHDIEQWQKFKNYGSAKRHELTKDLVAVHCTEISEKYEWLLSTSWNARYHHYQHDPQIVNRSVSFMKDIRTYCDPESKKPQKLTKGN